MEMSMKLEIRNSYLYIAIQGKYNLDRAKKLFLDAVKAAQRHNMTNLLVDYREIDGNSTSFQQFDYAEFVASFLTKSSMDGSLPTMRLAYVGKRPFYKPNKFGETVALNRGAIVKDTDNYEEALAWLLGGTDSVIDSAGNDA